MSQTRDKIVELLEDPEIEDPKAMADRIIAIVQGTNPPPIPQYGEPRSSSTRGNRQYEPFEVFEPGPIIYNNARNVEDIVCREFIPSSTLGRGDRQHALAIARRVVGDQILNYLINNNFIEVTILEQAGIIPQVEVRGRLRAVRF
jgi:hypothetical protein